MDMAWPERRAAYPHKHRDDVGGTRGDLGHGDLTKVGTLGNFGELCSFHSNWMFFSDLIWMIWMIWMISLVFE